MSRSVINPLDHLVLVVHCKTVAAENGAKLTQDVQFVFPVVLDEHSSEVWSAGDIVGWKLWKGVSRSHIHLPNIKHSIHLDEKYNGVSK